MKLTRRYFLKSTGALAAYCGMCPSATLASLYPQTVHKNKTLVVIFLRGGMDGLNFLVPFGDPAYAGLRPSLAIPDPGKPNGALDLDGYFALHPEARSLHDILLRGDALGLHAVGYDRNTRSHFEEQDTWETGVIGNTVQSDGWLNRHLATSEGQGPIRAVAIGDTLPRILQGPANALSIRGLEQVALAGNDSQRAETMLAALEHAYCTPEPDKTPAAELLEQSSSTTLDAMRHLGKIAAEPYQPSVPYPRNPFANRLQTAARLIKANVGLEVVEITLGGWDTHGAQGSVDGTFGTLTRTLSEGLAAFYHDMGNRMDDVMVLTLSDFGRTAAENGNGGTDHGWGNCMLALGGGIAAKAGRRRGPVLADWPGLGADFLHQNRDLRHTMDFRDVMGEIVHHHLGNPAIKKVLPNHAFKEIGLLT